MLLAEPIEACGGQPKQVGILQRTHRLGAESARNQPRLADCLSPTSLVDHTLSVVRVAQSDGKPAADDDVHGIARVALTKQDCACR